MAMTTNTNVFSSREERDHKSRKRPDACKSLFTSHFHFDAILFAFPAFFYLLLPINDLPICGPTFGQDSSDPYHRFAPKIRVGFTPKFVHQIQMLLRFFVVAQTIEIEFFFIFIAFQCPKTGAHLATRN